jgi:hypothetical protein
VVEKVLQLRSSRARLAVTQAKHAAPMLDVSFLDTRTLTWREEGFAFLSAGGAHGSTSADRSWHGGAGVGAPGAEQRPRARMHFGCAALGTYLCVAGGAAPTAMATQPVDCAHTRIFCLDMAKRPMRWSELTPLDSTVSVDVAIRLAEGDLATANKRVENTKMAALSLGVRPLATSDHREALKVCVCPCVVFFLPPSFPPFPPVEN